MKLFLREHPRAIALATDTHVLILRHSPQTVNPRASSTTSLNEGAATAPRCIVEFSTWESQDMSEYRTLSSLKVHGTLGLVTISNDVFLCVVNASSKVATVRPEETIQRILSVEFHCLTRSDYDYLLNDQINPFPTDDLDASGHDYSMQHARENVLEHPCLALKKLLSGGSFYYSADFDLTKRLQDRPEGGSTVAIDSLDSGFLWNAYMIQPLVDFRSRLSEREKDALDGSRILTSAIRGFAATVTVPASSSPARVSGTGFPSNMTLISRLSCRRAGTRFNARGIDDDGNVANFVETETIFTTDTICFSYTQIRGSVPMFWEQASGLPGQQKITITRSAEATQPAFDKHFDMLSKAYGDVFVVNLLSDEKSQELQITNQYAYHIKRSALNRTVENHKESGDTEDHVHLRHLNYDFHAQTRGPNGYEAASGIRRFIEPSAIAFEYFLTEHVRETIMQEGRKTSIVGENVVLNQAGVFRTNCLDCLDRTNLIQTIISQLAVEIFLRQQGERSPTSDFWARHGTLWADCGDALSKIYAGTGALKSSFTRSGKMSVAGMLADVRKSAQRLYINNFEDKGRQNVIDMLLGRLIGQTPVNIYDPINDWVTAELTRRVGEYSSTESIDIYVGTFNLNGKTAGLDDDLSVWLCPPLEKGGSKTPEIVAVAFQEIVNLDVQQIMSTDPHRRMIWEDAVRKTLNANARAQGNEEYVLLRGGQLVGASLSVFVKASALPMVKNVEGAVKKTGMSGMAGNKGAVAIRMEYAATSICLVTAHLAAGFANYEERNADYKTISSGLRFQRNRSIEDHDTIIWFGDFNYRIGMDNDRARALISKGQLGALYEHDQLNIQMVHGKTFPFYTETTPTFPPTYKFNLGTDDYDTSDKSRIPAWTDRIVTKGDNLRQLHYACAPLRFSDHRPVWGLFHCAITVIDQATRDRISGDLYARRRAAVGSHTASQAPIESDDESLIGYEAVEPGLPPASSERRKWWLDNGLPARSTVQPPSPGKGYVLNPARSSNPFAPSSEPDWVKVERPGAPPERDGSGSVASNNNTASKTVVGKRVLLPPPPLASRIGAATPPEKPPRPSSAAAAEGSEVGNPAQQLKKQTLRKRPSALPPPKPVKPRMLRGDSSASHASNRGTVVAPPVPEPRRGGRGVAAASSSLGRGTVGGEEAPPVLPPRRGTGGGLMDDDGGGGGGELMRGWEPLKPG